MTHSIPNHIGSQLERADWEPKEALQFYADGNHFDVVDGKTRILDTGGIASNALKSLSIARLELKGDAELHELREKVIAQQARIEQLREALEMATNGLTWWMDNLPHDVTEADHEEMESLQEALSTPDDLSALRAHDAALTAKHIEICKKLAAENEGLAGEVWCERCADAIEKAGVL